MATIKIPVPNYTPAQKDRLDEITRLQAVKLREIADLKREADAIYTESLVYGYINSNWIGVHGGWENIKQALMVAKLSLPKSRAQTPQGHRQPNIA